MLNSAFVGSATGRDAAEQHVNAGPSTPRQRQAVGSQGPRSFQQLDVTQHARHQTSRHHKHKFAETRWIREIELIM